MVPPNVPGTSPQPIVRMLQIIVLPLAMGVMMFLGVVVALKLQQGAPLIVMPQGVGIWLIAIAVAAGCGAASAVVPQLIVRNQTKQLTAEAWADRAAMGPKTLSALFSLKTIVGAALLEGAAFFNLIAYQLEGAAPSVVVALLLLVGILMHLPTEGKFSAWCDTQERNHRDAAAWGERR